MPQVHWWIVDGRDDIVRLGIVAMSLIVLTVGAFRLHYWRHQRISRASIMLRGALFMFIIATCWASVENLRATAVPPGIRSYLSLTATVWALLALVFEACDTCRNQKKDSNV